jgi:hypothetical protein
MGVGAVKYGAEEQAVPVVVAVDTVAFAGTRFRGSQCGNAGNRLLP